MSTVVNIIHPYTYKMRGKNYIIGPIPPFEARDRKVASFVNMALEHNISVIHHRDSIPGTQKALFRDLAFHEDPLYSFLFDPRIIPVVTTQWGVPIDDKKPKGTSSVLWAQAEQTYTKHTELQRIVGNLNLILLIGGALENCLRNMAVYFVNNYHFPFSAVKYIPELCVSFDPTERQVQVGTLAAKGIEALSYERALELIVQQ